MLRLGETSLAGLATLGLRSRVTSLMACHGRQMDKCFPASPALKRPLSGVDPFVMHKVNVLHKCSLAKLTPERFFTCVHLFVRS